MKADARKHVHDISSNGWQINEALWNKLSPYSKQFMIDELTGFGSYDYYTKRVQAIGFINKGKILDAACGNAQWSVVMSKNGNEIYSIDINEETINAAKEFMQLNGADNTRLATASIDTLPYANEMFDGIVCYSAIMYTDYAKTLAEFNRVLKKGGHAYISTDGAGWLMHLLVDKGLLKLSLGETKKYLRRIYYKYQNERKNKTANLVITKDYFRKLIEANGFRIVEMKPEGMISTFAPAPAARYPEKYYGFQGIIDVLIEKI